MTKKDYRIVIRMNDRDETYVHSLALPVAMTLDKAKDHEREINMLLAIIRPDTFGTLID